LPPRTSSPIIRHAAVRIGLEFRSSAEAMAILTATAAGRQAKRLVGRQMWRATRGSRENMSRPRRDGAVGPARGAWRSARYDLGHAGFCEWFGMSAAKSLIGRLSRVARTRPGRRVDPVTLGAKRRGEL